MLLTLEKIIELSEKKISYLQETKQNNEITWKYIKKLKEWIEQIEKGITDNDDIDNLEIQLWGILWSYLCLIDSLEVDEKTTREEILHKVYKKHKYEKDKSVDDTEEKEKQQETKSKVSAFLWNLLKNNNK